MTLIRWIYLALRGLVIAVGLLIAGIVTLLVIAFRRIAPPLGLVLLALVALVGLAAVVFEIDGGRGTLSLAHLATLIHLPDARHYVGSYLHNLDAHKAATGIAIAAGIGAVIIGLLLLAGTFIPRRQRIVALATDQAGRIAARRRALAQAAATLAERPDEVANARARVRPHRRRPGATVRVRATRTHPAPRKPVEADISQQLTPLTDPYDLKTKVRARRATDPPEVR